MWLIVALATYHAKQHVALIDQQASIPGASVIEGPRGRGSLGTCRQHAVMSHGSVEAQLKIRVLRIALPWWDLDWILIGS